MELSKCELGISALEMRLVSLVSATHIDLCCDRETMYVCMYVFMYADYVSVHARLILGMKVIFHV
jgi:hypothetical protein